MTGCGRKIGVYEKRCGAKAMFCRYTVAVKAATRATVRTGELIHPYQCPDCGMWHIGHASYGESNQFDQDKQRLCRGCKGRIGLDRIILGAVYCSKECKNRSVVAE